MKINYSQGLVENSIKFYLYSGKSQQQSPEGTLHCKVDSTIMHTYICYLLLCSFFCPNTVTVKRSHKYKK